MKDGLYTMENFVKYRRDLHKIPEIRMEEHKTSAYIQAVLKNHPCKLETVIGTGILAFYDNNAGETIAFRADMDALNLPEVKETEYKSTHPGTMHACGHDGHMSMLLSLSDYLAQNYTKFQFNVLLIFQPAEESIGGAEQIIASGALDKYNITRIFGYHVWPGAPVGTITTKPGPLMARASELTLTVTGKSAHCATPESGIDANEVLVHIINDAYTMRETELPEGTLSLLRFGVIKGGDVRNILAQKAEALGSVRAFDDGVFDFMMKRLTEICAHYDAKYGSKTEIHATTGYPAVMNDEKLFEEFKTVLSENNINFALFPKPHMTGEDFAFFQKKYPGLFAFVGLGDVPALHNNQFDFDERALETGIKGFIGILEHYNK